MLTRHSTQSTPTRCAPTQPHKNHHEVRHDFDNAISPAERLLYERDAKIHREIGLSASSITDVTGSDIVTFHGTTPALQPPTSIATWYQQPHKLPHKCGASALQGKSKHPLSPKSFDAVLPQCTNKCLDALAAEFRQHTGDVPRAKVGMPKKVTYIKTCAELCAKKQSPLAFTLGVGLCNALKHIMKLVGGFKKVNETDTILQIQVKSGTREKCRFYAWLVTGSGNPVTSDLIQLQVVDGMQARPPTTLTYARQKFVATKCEHPDGLASTYPAMATFTDVALAALIVNSATATSLIVTELDATFVGSDRITVAGATTGKPT